MRRRYTATVIHEAYHEQASLDRYRNPQPGYVATPRPVFAIAPKQSVESDELGRRAVLSGKTIYADWEPGPHDRIVIDGETWVIDGEPAVWDNNPHVPVTRQRGVAFDIERTTG